MFLALAMLFCAASAGRVTRAEDLETNFDALTTQYSETWQQAAESTRRSSQLEQQLNAVAKRVADARKRADQAVQQRQDIRAQARGIRTLTLALRKQLDVLHEENRERIKTFSHQKDLFSDFVRMHALTADLSVDTGPVIGGTVLRRLLHGSLGDQIQDDLHSDALLQARISILASLTAEAQASEKSEADLNATARELAGRLETLKNLHAAATDATATAQDELTQAVVQRELTESEYSAVKQAMDEQLASIRSLQNNISSVQQELKDFRDKKLSAEIERLSAKEQELAKKEQELLAKVDQLHATKKAAQDSYDRAQEVRNSDKDLYRDIERAKLDLENKQARLQEIDAMVAPENQDVTNVEWQQYRKAKSEERSLKTAIAWIQDELSYMQNGWPKKMTDDYLTKRLKAQNASEQLPGVTKEQADAHAALLAVQADLAKAKDEREKNASSNFTFSTLPSGSSGFIWPIKGRLTAGYLDAAYEAHFRVPHRAIDIAVSQGTPVFAARDGVVFTVKDGGAKGYSYVLIAHDDGYSTIYGHLSAMYVSPGQLIAQGHVIGLSGGTPGTSGAGWMTTGPHLHFEVHKDGKSVNPLSVLP